MRGRWRVSYVVLTGLPLSPRINVGKASRALVNSASAWLEVALKRFASRQACYTQLKLGVNERGTAVELANGNTKKAEAWRLRPLKGCGDVRISSTIRGRRTVRECRSYFCRCCLPGR